MPEPRLGPIIVHVFTCPNSLLKYNWKYTQFVTRSNILLVADATCLSSFGNYEPVSLILTLDAFIIVNMDEDMTQRILCLNEVVACENACDPTLMIIKLVLPKPEPKVSNTSV